MDISQIDLLEEEEGSQVPRPLRLARHQTVNARAVNRVLSPKEQTAYKKTGTAK